MYAQSIRPRRALAAAVLTSVLMLGGSYGTTACRPTADQVAWKLEKTHGVLIELGAGRGSLEIFRVPTKRLYNVYLASRIKGVQDVLWAVGKPPAIQKTFTFKGKAVTLEFGPGTKALRDLSRRAIYDHPDDLLGALADAHAEHNCLAITLVSLGRPTINWTRKTSGCVDGSA